MLTCSYCLSNRPHALFCYLARDGRVAESNISNQYCYIGVSRSPFHRLQQHNRVPNYRVGSKSTKNIAPHWIMELVIGGFECGGACAFKKQWRKSSRRFNRRIKWGITQAFARKHNIYCRNRAFIETILRS